MVKHSQAIQLWNSIWNRHTPFPFKATMKNGMERVHVTASLVKMYLYFKHLDQDTDKKEIVKSRTEVGKGYLTMYPFIPHTFKENNKDYARLVEYFLQQPHYTPIDLKTVRPLWESYH